jgi:hypothetical protein
VRDETTDLPLHGIELTDARTGERIDLGRLPDVHVLTLIRHRY